MFYNLEHDNGFKNVFSDAGDLTKFFLSQGHKLKELYYKLENETGISWSLTDDQKKKFLQHFANVKTEIQQDVSCDLNGVVNRMGVQFYRIAMILSILRNNAEIGFRNNKIECSDQDFKLTLSIVNTLKYHSLKTYFNLPKRDIQHKLIDKADQIKKAYELRNTGKSFADISEIIFGNKDNKGTIYRWIHYKK
jgi:hypothetical protein